MAGSSSTLDRITVKFIRTRSPSSSRCGEQPLQVATRLREGPDDAADPLVHLGARAVDRDVEAADAGLQHLLHVGGRRGGSRWC